MSFCSELKKTLCITDELKSCCLRSFITGLRSGERSRGGLKPVIRTDLSELVESLRSVPGISIKKTTSRSGNERYCISTDSGIYNGFSPGCAGCAGYYIRGAFLACGGINPPDKRSHLEFIIYNPDSANELFAVMSRTGITPKSSDSNGHYKLYIKSGEVIEDFLYIIGAKNFAYTYMNEKIIKDVRNNVNRVMNFESANLSRASKTSAEQIEAIKKIIRSGKFDELNDELKHTAKLRLEHFECSLSELCEKCGGISKSGLNHRLRKIMDFAAEL